MHHVDSMHHSRHVAASVKSMLMSAWYCAGLRGSGLLGFMAAEAMSQKHAAAYSCVSVPPADDAPCHVRHEDTDKIRTRILDTKGMFSIGKPRRLNVAACGFLLRITSRAVR